MSESAPDGQLNGEPVSEVATEPTEGAIASAVEQVLADESASVPTGDIEVEAEMVVKKVEVLMGSLNNAAEESVPSEQTPQQAPETKTEEPTPPQPQAAAPQEDRTEDQVTEIIEDDKLGAKEAAAAALSAPSLEDVANLPEDETSKAEEPAVVPKVETTAPVEEEQGGLKQLEIVLKDEALLTAGDSITVDSVSEVKTESVQDQLSATVAQGELTLPGQGSTEVSVSEVSQILDETPASENVASEVSKKTSLSLKGEEKSKLDNVLPEPKSEISEDISKKISASKIESVPDEKPSKKESKIEELKLEEKSIKKVSKVGGESEEVVKKVSLSKAETAPEETPVKKVSKFEEPVEEPNKKTSIIEEKLDKKVSKVEEAPVEDMITRKFSKPAETVPESPSKKISGAPAPEVPEKKTSVSFRGDEPMEKPGSRKGSLTVIQESEKSLTEEPKSESLEVSKSETAEQPKKKTSRYDKLDQQQPSDKLSKFGGRVGKKFSSKEEPKVEDEPQKTPRAKRSAAAAKPAPAEEAPKVEEPPKVEEAAPAEEPPAAADMQEGEHVVEAVISLGAPKEAPAAEEPAPMEAETAPLSTEPVQEEPKKEEEESVRKPSARAQFSPSATEQPSSKPEEQSAAVERKPSSRRVAYSASSSHVPAATTYPTTYTSPYAPREQPTHTKADYLPYYRHTPSYVSTFDNLVNISSFAQNLWPLEHSRSRSRIRERSRSRSRYQTPTRDYSLPSKFGGPAYDTAVSRSTSTSNLSGYPLSRSSTLKVYGGTPPADTISHFYTNQESSVDRFINRINEPLSTYQYRNYSSSFYHPPYPSYTRAFSFEKPITYGSNYSGGYGSYGRPYYPSYESRPFISGLRASRFDMNEGRYHPSYSFSRGIALTSGPLMSRSGYW